MLLKNARGKPIETLEIPSDFCGRMMSEIVFSVNELLNSVEILLKNNGDLAIAAGIYMFAVEEYGKLLLLKRYIPSNGKVEVKYRDEFRSHAAKFKIAKEVLPAECITLHEGAFDPDDFEPEDFDTGEVADGDTRQAVFYADFTGDFTSMENCIKSPPAVDKELLEKAVDKLRSIATITAIP